MYIGYNIKTYWTKLHKKENPSRLNLSPYFQSVRLGPSSRIYNSPIQQTRSHLLEQLATTEFYIRYRQSYAGLQTISKQSRDGLVKLGLRLW
jgi:hypothetical protein